uniref:tRNA/rRNA methyltransferase SpoU type domain-containing protein n=1 Tax=Aureoumbra lagunensis TaxID=44058 RepID=A0A7S3JZB3_9STRA
MAALASKSFILTLSCLERCYSADIGELVQTVTWLGPIVAGMKKDTSLPFKKMTSKLAQRCCQEIVFYCRDHKENKEKEDIIRALLAWLVALVKPDYVMSKEIWEVCAIAILSSNDATSRRRCVRLLERTKFSQEAALRALAVAEGGGTQVHLFTPAVNIIRHQKNSPLWLRTAIARRGLANDNPAIRKSILTVCLESYDWDWNFLRNEIAPRLDDVEMRKGKQWSRELDEKAAVFFRTYYEMSIENASYIRLYIFSSEFLSANVNSLGTAAHTAILSCPFNTTPHPLPEEDTLLRKLPESLDILKKWKIYRNYAQLRQVILAWLAVIEHTKPTIDLALEFALFAVELLQRDKEELMQRLGKWLCDLTGNWHDHIIDQTKKNKAFLLAMLSRACQIQTLVEQHLDHLDLGSLTDSKVIAAVPTDAWRKFEENNAASILSGSDIDHHLEVRRRISRALQDDTYFTNAEFWRLRCIELAQKAMSSQNVNRIAIIQACVDAIATLDAAFVHDILRCVSECRKHGERWDVMASVVEKIRVEEHSKKLCTAEQVTNALECCGSDIASVLAVLRCAAHVINTCDTLVIEPLLRAAFAAVQDCGSRSGKPILLRRLCLEVWAPSWQYDGVDHVLLHEAHCLLNTANDRPHVARILTLGLGAALSFGAGARLAPLLARILLYREPVMRLQKIADDDTHVHKSIQQSFARLCALALLEDESQKNVGKLACETALILFDKEEGIALEEKSDKGWNERLRLWQAFGILATRCDENESLRKTMIRVLPQALSRPAPSAVRYAVETAAVGWALRWPEILVPEMLDRLDRVRDGDESSFAADTGCGRELALSSLLVVCGHACPDSLRPRLLRAAFALQGSTRGIVRGTAQLLLLSMTNENETDSFIVATANNLRRDPDVRRNVQRQKYFFTELRAPRLRTLAGIIDSGVHEFTSTEFAESIVVQFRNYLQTQGKVAAQLERDRGESIYFSRIGIEHNSPTKNDAIESYTTSNPRTYTREGPLFQQRKLDELLLDREDNPLFTDEYYAALLGDHKREDQAKKRGRVRVIVCASLVDKIVNIGGLARSAEVFDCEALVISDRKIVSSQAFESVAVTAERWIPIRECKPGPPLRAWLQSMREQGYCIVALEQASGSIPLTQCYNKLPTPAVLLLGHEKEGIDVDCLALVDLCVEIPQLGLIRSLNVHVSGAILLWHWAQQYLLSSSAQQCLSPQCVV